VRVPPRAIGPKGPRWGETPGPRSRGRGRWDPQPALGLAIRPEAAVVGGFGRSDPGGQSVRGAVLPLARVGGLGEDTPLGPRRSTCVRPNPTRNKGYIHG